MTKTQRRFSYRKPRRQFDETPHGLVEVWEDGQPIGLLNCTRDGYALRNLEGELLDTTYRMGREASAGILSLLHSDRPIR